MVCAFLIELEWELCSNPCLLAIESALQSGKNSMSSDSFIHLHLHTEYSLLGSAVRIKQLMQKAECCKMSAVGLTDQGNLFGAIEFYKEAIQAGIKPILGCELSLTSPGVRLKDGKTALESCRNSHLTLLAQNNKGWHNLIKLVSRAHLDGGDHKACIDKELLAEHSEGLICLSGSINGEINQLILQEQIDAARESLEEFTEIFGRENFFLEIHDHGLRQQHVCAQQMIKFGKEFDLGLVAANDVHFLDRSDHEAHDVLVCIGEGELQSNERRVRYSPETYFKTSEEMSDLFQELPEAIHNTVAIAERCEVSMDLDPMSSAKYPKFDPPHKLSRKAYFRKLCNDGLRVRYGDRVDTDAELKARLDYEIEVIEEMIFESYFLIIQDAIKWARGNGIPVGPGRGSAAGSLVNYVLGITDVCPLRFGLVFENFLNPERVSPPDIDIDLCQVRRDEVIEYLRQKYGEYAVSHVATFGTLGAKSVVRDVARVLGLSYDDGGRLARMIPNELNITLEIAVKKNSKLKEALDTEVVSKQVWDYAKFLEGMQRGRGIHAAGIVISGRDLSDYIPLTRGHEGELVTQYAMGSLVELGLLKMNLLGLKTLTVIADAEELIRERESDFQIDTIDLRDKSTFDLFKQGETVGVPQMESGGISSLCKRMGVSRIEDISDLIAMYCPAQMEQIDVYMERKCGKKKIEYLHPLLEQVCSETYGLLIYQEQLLKAISLLSGLSLGTADLLRRSMAKKQITGKQEFRLFVEGCARTNQISKKKAKELFGWLEGLSVKVLNKSHSIAYGITSYQTAYLKAHYPSEFVEALLRSESWDGKREIILEEAQRMGIYKASWESREES